MADPITALPTAPTETDDQTTFSTNAFAMVAALDTFVSETNAVATAMNFNATNSTSSTSWTVASSGSQAFSIETGKSYVKGMTVKVASTATPQNWGLGDITAASSGSITVQFRSKNGSGTFSAWTISQNAEVSTLRTTREARTGNTQITSADVGKFIEITSGTFTQTFASASSLGSGFFVTIKNSGTGYVTLDPNSSETIDGRTSFHMFEGEAREIFCDGSNLHSLVINPFFRQITSSATYVIPPGYTRFGIRAWSGGGSGQRTNNASTQSLGGAGGGCVETILPASSFGTSEIVTIGAGGAAVTTVANGNTGGDTTFGSLLSVYAGANWKTGGSAIDGLRQDEDGGEAVYAGESGNIPTPNTGIWGGGGPSSNASADSSGALYGGGAGGSLNASATVRAAGTSTFGGNGGAASSASNGTAGTQPGGGGGATQTGTQSGAGGAGEVWFWGII